MQIADGVRINVKRSRSPPIVISSGRPKFVWISLTNRYEGRGPSKYTSPRHDQEERNAACRYAYKDADASVEDTR